MDVLGILTEECTPIRRLNTTHLVRNVMEHAARRLGLDLTDTDVLYRVYDECCGLEDWDEDHGFGSSDQGCYTRRVAKEFDIDLDAIIAKERAEWEAHS
jgi:hypothetical protein